ncbi:transmembrane protein 170B-like [Limulus polyphemus]|uniref:Transmembrane protein 170B-like n=1 Tax=Limulus polyphemus TaxID=6850 RepID=A0ABM1BYS5_LIMPO|nr:transmembrane protein 170B-like [Limulus polyphemus]XP_013791238.1 transmembrane protein 170B-like [Limulus polyphemus]XP_013791245.1 transmembrane protein 170B-like [Limulus polyphemus]XP_022236011.1 transmembrane protein 170B-like [Limulus polyphemus]
MGSSTDDFETAELDSIINVIVLNPANQLDTFSEMWYHVFLWVLFSSLFVHFCAAALAFGMLKEHKHGRFLPLLIVIFGVVSPLTGGVVTSAVIAGVYRASRFQMKALYALIWGIGQTILAAVMSYTRILATL